MCVTESIAAQTQSSGFAYNARDEKHCCAHAVERICLPTSARSTWRFEGAAPDRGLKPENKGIKGPNPHYKPVKFPLPLETTTELPLREHAPTIYLGNVKQTQHFKANQNTVPQSQPKACWAKRATRSFTIFSFRPSPKQSQCTQHCSIPMSKHKAPVLDCTIGHQTRPRRWCSKFHHFRQRAVQAFLETGTSRSISTPKTTANESQHNYVGLGPGNWMQSF